MRCERLLSTKPLSIPYGSLTMAGDLTRTSSGYTMSVPTFSVSVRKRAWSFCERGQARQNGDFAGGIRGSKRFGSSAVDIGWRLLGHPQFPPGKGHYNNPES